jgi:dehydrogenase/reductase SDR family protein 12
LTEKWARDYKEKGIGFYSMHPGWVETPGVIKSIPEFRNTYAKTIFFSFLLLECK